MRPMRHVGATGLHTLQALIAVFVGCLALSTPGLADTDAERAALARLDHELESLDPLIRAAQSHADPDARVRLRYDWLRQDLEQIRRAIQAHLDAPRTDPRTFPPLRGDYRQ